MTSEGLNKTIKDLVEFVNWFVSGFLIGYGYYVLSSGITYKEEEEICENYFEYEGEKGTVKIKWQA